MQVSYNGFTGERCRFVDEKTIRTAEDGPVTVADLPYINAIVRKGDRAEVGPGQNGTVKISHVKRTIVKSGR